MKDLYIVSKALQGRFTKSHLIRPIILLHFFNFLINMSIEVKTTESEICSILTF